MTKDEGLYRLHTGACLEKYARGNREARDCRCMIHFEGQIGADFIRQSVGTRAWSRAVAIAEAARKRGSWKATEPEPEADGIKVSEAVAVFLADIESVKGQNLSSRTVSIHRYTLNSLIRFCDSNGYQAVTDLSPKMLEDFKNSWNLRSVYAIRTAIQTVKKFCKFVRGRGYIETNPAEWLTAPNILPIERMPFSPDEESRIYQAATGKALLICYVMRFAGLAIVDAANLHESELKGDEIRYFRKKTIRRENRKRVIVPIPGWLASELKVSSRVNGYYFKRELQTVLRASKYWTRILEAVFKKAEVANASSHRFRHTFATRLLEAGERIEDVSKWLGHSSVKTTERYYSHWTEDRTNAASEKLRKRYALSGKPV